MTMNDTWGYKSYDDNWKSARDLIRNLIDIASKGGNYLLNVGPTAEGLIPQPSVERLAEVGRWMRANGEAIYGTNPSPFATQLLFGRATSKPDRVYLHVFDWPANGTLSVASWGKRVKRAYLLVSPRDSLKFTQTADAVTVRAPQTAADPIATVVVLETGK
jgi:alpha-L-fucosidase